MKLRIGEGWDIHALVEGRKLILGGVDIPHSKGLLGHSDADALLHAITDALLGAAGLGDIGSHFPDTQTQFQGADSAALLSEVVNKVRALGYQIGNVDCTVIAQAPKLAPHIAAMRTRIAQVLGIDPDQINVKAKTAEKMGPVGEGRAMEARAVVLLGSESLSRVPHCYWPSASCRVSACGSGAAATCRDKLHKDSCLGLFASLA